jgi:hypothetical protein
MSQFQQVNIKSLFFYLFCFFTPLFAACSLEVQVWFMVKDSGEDMYFVHVAYYRSFNHYRRPRIEKDVLFTLFSLFFSFLFFWPNLSLCSYSNMEILLF